MIIAVENFNWRDFIEFYELLLWPGDGFDKIFFGTLRIVMLCYPVGMLLTKSIEKRIPRLK